jgi:hypothetical protein
MDQVLTDTPALTHSILGTADPAEIAGRLDTFCKGHLGSRLDKVFFCELSVGAAFGLRLNDGRWVFLKAHPPDRPHEFLGAVCRVQRHLFEQGFPAPRPLTGPASFGAGLATVDEFVDEGEHGDAHDPSIRRTMAQTLAWLVDLASEVPDIRGLIKGGAGPRRGGCGPNPTTPSSTSRLPSKEPCGSTRWPRRKIMDGFDCKVMVGHTDWSVDQMRFKSGEYVITQRGLEMLRERG